MNPKKLFGFSLIEVLISLLLLSLILLGFDAMEIFALRENRAAYYFSVATNQLNTMLECLRALNSRDGLAQQIAIWNQQNQDVLPNGIGVVVGSYPMYTVTIYWGEIQHSCEKMRLGESGCLNEEVSL